MTQDRRINERRPGRPLVQDFDAPFEVLTEADFERIWNELGGMDAWTKTFGYYQFGFHVQDAIIERVQDAASQSQAVPSELASLHENEEVRQAIAEGLRGLWGCGRVWSAWSVGTMGEDDFYAADESDECIDQMIHSISFLFSHSAATGKDRPTDDHLWDETIRDRDTYHEWADKLAEAISKHFGAYIGEHSNTNCPWAEALEAIENAEPGAATGKAPEDLPKLPKPFGEIDIYEDSGNVRSVDGFTADQMRGYAIDYAAKLGRAALASPAAPLAGKAEPSDNEIMDKYSQIVSYPERLTPGDYATAIKLVRAFSAPLAAAVPAEEASGYVVFAEFEGKMVAQWPFALDMKGAQEHAAMYGDSVKTEIRPLYTRAPAEPAPILASALTDEPVAKVTQGGEFGPGLAFLANGLDMPKPGTLLYAASPAMNRYRFLLSFLLDRGVLHRHKNGVWRLRGIYGVDDSGLKGAGRTPEEALDNAIVAVNLDPVAAEKFWQKSCDEVLARLSKPTSQGTADLSASGLLKLWKRANAEATDTMPASFQFAKLLLATQSPAQVTGEPASIDTPEFRALAIQFYTGKARNRKLVSYDDLVAHINRHIAAHAPADRDAVESLRRIADGSLPVEEMRDLAGKIADALSQPAASHGAVEGEQK